MTKPAASAEKASTSRPATVTELFNEYDAYSLRVRNTAPKQFRVA